MPCATGCNVALKSEFGRWHVAQRAVRAVVVVADSLRVAIAANVYIEN